MVGKGLHILDAQALQVEEGWLELVPDTGDKELGALVDGPPEVGLWDIEVMGEELEDRGELELDVRGEDGGTHAKDPWEVLLLDTFGLEVRDD